MGKVIVQDYTYKKPITMIGVEAGICWGANTSNDEKNYLRGIDCLESGHGRTFEFPDVYLTLEGYSARVIREWYTHIGGLPTRLQASTRYIDYEHGFGYVTPPSIEGNPEAKKVYEDLMEHIKSYLESLDTIGVPREDSALGLPLGMETKIVCKHNMRNLMDMSHQRMCNRAYERMRVKTIVDEDFTNYKKPAMFIGTISCGGKCCIEAGIPLSVCQNDGWRASATISIDDEQLCLRYLNNPLTESIVFGGLEPLEQFDELCSFLEVLRGQFQCKDDVVIYTGYYFEEVPEWIQQLATYGNVIVKFGRYIPNQKHIFDEVLGVELASDNQYAERFDS